MTSERFLALALLLSLAACHSHAEGTHVAIHSSAAPVEALTDQAGGVLALERLELRLDTFELLFCEEPVAAILRTLFLPGVARALHPTGDTPTVLEGPLPIDLVEGGELALGELHPPAGRYCGAMLVFGQATLEGTYEESPFAHELALGSPVFVTFDPLELSASALDGEVRIYLDASGLLGSVDLSVATADDLTGSIEESLPDIVLVEARLVEPLP